MKKERLNDLLELYIRKNSSKSEELELMELLSDPELETEKQRLLEALMDHLPEKYSLTQSKADDMFRRIIENSPATKQLPDERQIMTRVTVARIPRIGFRKWAAAVMVISLAGTVYYFLTREYQKNNIGIANHTPRIENHVKPGSNKAVLTLANGEKINLDSIKTGTVATQTGAKVIKLDDGRLMYQPVAVSKRTNVELNILSTPRGGQYKLNLPDGSTVWLNAASSIRYPTVFAAQERVVEVSGEVYFEVVHNTDWPFKVKVNNREEVEVLGTHFNINAYEDESDICTTLLQGSIRLHVTGSQQPVLLKPNGQAVLNHEGEMKLIENADCDEAVAWKNGMFEFDGHNIQTIMRQIARWYDVDVKYEGNMTDEYFTGQISRYAQVSQVLKMLELTKDIHFKMNENKITVTP